MRARESAFAGALVCCLVGFVFPASACINTLKSDIRHHQANGDDETVARVIGELEADHASEPNLEHTNDLAVARIMTRRYAEAIELLEDAEKRFPGNAIVAANLGTALELSGRDAEALRWIREGVTRDPKEHFGSEWLHVRILEAKIALAKDPRWLKSNSVLGVSFGDGVMPIMPPALPADETGRPRSPLEVSAALNYQLNERKQFVNPPDPIMGDLYAAEGDLIFANGRVATLNDYLGFPTDSYLAALIYGSTHKERVEMRSRHFDSMYTFDTWIPPPPGVTIVHESDPPSLYRAWLPWAAGLLLLAVAVPFVAWLERRRSLRKP